LQTANFRIVGYWNAQSAFLICLGRSPIECEYSLVDAADHMHMGWLRAMSGAEIQEWRPTLNPMGRWCRMYDCWGKLVRAVKSQQRIAA